MGFLGGLISGLFGVYGANKQRDHDSYIAEQNWQLQRETNEQNFGLQRDIANENFALQRDIAQQNLGFQQQNLDWQRYAQQHTWNREDNAVQRRVADLQAAGLSPTLAAGSAAQTHTPISTQAPQMDTPQRGTPQKGLSQRQAVNQQSMALADMFLNLTRQKSEIARTQAETERIRKQTAMIDPLYELDVQKAGFEMQRVANDTERVGLAAKQLGISERSLENDIRRVGHDYQRVQLETRRVINDEARLIIERDAKDSLRLLHDAQIGRISEQNLVSELQRKGMTIDQARHIVDYKRLIYDYVVSVEFGTKTTDPMTNQAGVASRLGDLTRGLFGFSTRTGDASSLAEMETDRLISSLHGF